MVNKTILRQIKEMVRVDQSLRFNAMREKNGATKSGSKALSFNNYLIYIVDFVHGCKIRDIVSKYGYPNVRSVGKKGMHSLWLLVQHQDQNLDFQKECLKECEFSTQDKAYLTDRILLSDGKKQIYGTQFKGFDKSGEPISRPIKDIKNIDGIRKSAGLGSFAEYKEFFKKSHQNKNK